MDLYSQLYGFSDFWIFFISFPIRKRQYDKVHQFFIIQHFLLFHFLLQMPEDPVGIQFWEKCRFQRYSDCPDIIFRWDLFSFDIACIYNDHAEYRAVLFLPQISVGYPRQVIQIFYLIFFFVFAFVVNYGSRAVRKFEQIVQAQFVYFDSRYVGWQHSFDLRQIQSVYTESLSFESLGQYFAGDILVLVQERRFSLPALVYTFQFPGIQAPAWQEVRYNRTRIPVGFSLS